MTVMTPLTGELRRRLKQQAHHLKPVVLLGQAGLTDAVLAEIELALDHHELIKVRINADDRESREAQAMTIAARTGAGLVQRIGHVATYFRANPRRNPPPPPAPAPAPARRVVRRPPAAPRAEPVGLVARAGAARGSDPARARGTETSGRAAPARTAPWGSAGSDVGRARRPAAASSPGGRPAATGPGRRRPAPAGPRPTGGRGRRRP